MTSASDGAVKSICVFLAALVSACAPGPDGPDDGGRSAAEDAATNVPTTSSGWRFVPDVRVDGDRELLVGVGVVAVADDWFAITQSQDRQLRFYDMSGEPLGRFGGQGEGPGEFEFLSSIGWQADTLWVWDSRLRRITFISPERELAREQPLASADPRRRDDRGLPRFARPNPRAVYPDGSILAEAPLPPELEESCPDCGPQLVLLAADGYIDRIVGVLPKNDAMASYRTATGSGAIRIPFRSDPVDAFAIDGSVTASGVAAVEGEDAGTYELTVLDARGDTVFDRRYAFEPDLIPARVADSARAARMEDARLPEQLRELLRDAKLPPMYNPLRSLRVGSDGSIWVWMRRPSETAEWLILDQRGEPLDTMRLPANQSILSASLHDLWVAARDTFGVPSVVRYRIER